MTILENNIKKFINKLFNKPSENNVNKFINKLFNNFKVFDISIVKEYCYKNIDNFNYILNDNNKEHVNLKVLGELNSDFFKYYLNVESDDFSFSLDKINKDKYPDREIIHVGYIGHSRVICLPNKDSLYDDEDPYENFDEPGFYTCIYMFIFAEILILKYEKLDKYVKYDEFIKNELSSIV